MIDYHIHTPLCNHASDTIGQYIESGVKKQFREICFLDHLTIDPFDTSDPQGPGVRVSMDPEEVAFYYQALMVFKYGYAAHIEVKTGLEVDFNPDHVSRIQDILNTFAFDAIGGSVHFINGVNIASRRVVKGLSDAEMMPLFDQYIKKLEKMLDYAYFDIVCHLDVIRKFNKVPMLDRADAFDHILNKIKDKNLVVEINTGGFTHPVKDHYPSIGIIEKCRQLDIPITLGSDAHYADSVGQFYDQTIEMLKSIGYTKVTGFTQRVPHDISIMDHY